MIIFRHIFEHFRPFKIPGISSSILNILWAFWEHYEILRVFSSFSSGKFRNTLKNVRIFIFFSNFFRTLRSGVKIKKIMRKIWPSGGIFSSIIEQFSSIIRDFRKKKEHFDCFSKNLELELLEFLGEYYRKANYLPSQQSSPVTVIVPGL